MEVYEREKREIERLDPKDVTEDTDETLVQAAEKAMEDENICYSIWNDFEEDCFYNSGEIEYEVVTDALERYIEKEGE